MSLLQELQAAATDDGTSVSSLLRKCQVLATRVAYAPLRQWAEHELNGYPPGSDLPDYRVMKGVESKGTFVDRFRQISNVQINDAGLPDDLRAKMHTLKLWDGVGTYEAMVREAAGTPNSGLANEWPPEIVSGWRTTTGMQLIEARQELPMSYIAGMLDQIKNRVLSLSLELEQMNPALGEQPGPPARTDSEKVAAVYHQTILGGQQTFVSGGEVNQRILVAAGDLDGLIERILDLGVPRREAQGLADALDADGHADQGIGQSTRAWLEDAGRKIASGAWKAATQAAPDVIAAVIKSYLGQP